MTSTTTWASPTTQPYPCDRGFGDGVGRGYHGFYGATRVAVICMYCGRYPSQPLRTGAVTSGGDTTAYKGETYVLSEAEPLQGFASWWEQ